MIFKTIFNIKFLLLITLTPAISQRMLIQMSCQSTDIISNRNFYIDSIIDARMIRNNIGIVQKGLENRKVEVNFSRSLAEEFLSCIHQTYPRENDNQRRVVLIVRDLWVSEFSSVFYEIGRVSLNLSFCSFDENGTGEILFETNKYLEESKRKDITKTHSRRIEKVLDESIRSFATSNSFDNIKPFSVNRTTLFNSDNIQNGVYRDFISFLNNSVLDSIPVIKKYKNDGRKAFLDKSIYKDNTQKYFAIFDGNELYINSFTYTNNNNNYFAKVVSRGRYILIDDTITPALAGVLFGVIGSAALNHRGVVIDVLNGMPKLLNEENFIKIIESDPETLKYYKSINHNSFEIRKSLIDRINKKFSFTLGE